MFSYTRILYFFKNGNTPIIILTRFVSVIFVLSMAAGSSAVKAQIAPKPKAPGSTKTESATTSKVNRVRAPRVRSGSPADSYNFLVLGDRFYEKGRRNAAEAAYRESIRLWPGSEAHAALRELHEATRVK